MQVRILPTLSPARAEKNRKEEFGTLPIEARNTMKKLEEKYPQWERVYRMYLFWFLAGLNIGKEMKDECLGDTSGGAQSPSRKSTE